MLGVWFWLLGYPHLLAMVTVLTADCFGQKFVLGETLLLVQAFLPLLAQIRDQDPSPSWADTSFLKQEGAWRWKVADCPPSLVEYCWLPCTYLE